MSRVSDSPPIVAIARSSSSAACGTSSPVTAAPSRASVAAIAAPIPREAPVTSADFHSSGRSQSILPGSATPAPTRMTWPET